MKYELTKRIERIQIWLAWKMPKWLVKWCSVRLMCNATQGKYSDQVVPDLTAMDALQRWSD